MSAARVRARGCAGRGAEAAYWLGLGSGVRLASSGLLGGPGLRDCGLLGPPRLQSKILEAQIWGGERRGW